MGRFGDFAAIWFATLVALNFVVFRALGAPFGMYVETLVSATVGFVLAAVLVVGLGVSFPGALEAE